MVEVVRTKRKSPVLTPSSIPCLSQLPTINITQGCSLGCTYCYIQGYSHHPGPDRVVLFENTAELVRDELKRRRRLPSRVYFSPSSDAFQYLPEVQEVSFQTMSVLLDAEIEVSFLTKGFVEDRFIRLFAERPQLVFAQVGITTLQMNLWKLFEPRTAPPHKRIACLRALTEVGVTTTARLDPLFPDVTDTEENLTPLFQSLRETGIRDAAASYLFLRPPFAANVTEQVNRLSATAAEPVPWEYQRFATGCGGGRMIASEDRAKRFARLVSIGQRFDIRITACRCKNPELASETCQIAGPPVSATRRQVSQGAFDFQPASFGRRDPPMEHPRPTQVVTTPPRPVQSR